MAPNYSPTCPTFLASPKHSPASPLSSTIGISPSSPLPQGKASYTPGYSPSYKTQPSQYSPSEDDYQKYSPSSPTMMTSSNFSSVLNSPKSPHSTGEGFSSIGRPRKVLSF